MKQEQYKINFNLEKPEGGWIWNKTEDVFVDLAEGEREKKSGKIAEEILRQKYEGRKLNVESVVYC